MKPFKTVRGVTALAAFAVLIWTPAAPSLAAGALEPVGPITASPTHQARPGKVVWADLVTADVRGAGAFYREVLGWDLRYSGDGSFAGASHNGGPVATISAWEGDEAPDGEARWLISISVPDVDAAAAAAARNGGEVLEGPEDLANRGRYVLVSDPRGALVMLLQASGGDPHDSPAADNGWLWAELWTDDPASAVAFYEAVVGYRTVTVKDRSGDEIQVMGRDTRARASVVKLPWEDVEPNWLPWLQVADVAATTRSAMKHGGEIVIAPMRDSDGSSVAVLADPTGGVFAIQQRGEQ